MQESCICDLGGGNQGLLDCIPKFGITGRLIFVRRGADNALDPNAAIDQTFITEKINEDDLNKRWYLGPYIERASERADPETVSRDSGREFVIRKGIRTDTIIIDDVETIFLSKLELFECGKWAVFFIGKDNKSIRGKVSGSDGLMYPVPVEKVWTNWMDKTDVQPEAVNLYFNWGINELDSKVRFISNIPGTFEDVEGLIDLYQTNGASTTSTSIISFTSPFSYGSLNNTEVYEGMTTDDILDISNVTAASTLTKDSIEEVSPGSYELTVTELSTGSVGDKLLITLNIEGYDVSEFNKTEIEITA